MATIRRLRGHASVASRRRRPSAAVEVSVAINPTNPDHLIAVSIARLANHPGISDFAYVSIDAGKTWKVVPARTRIRRSRATTRSHSHPTVWLFMRSFPSPAFGNLDQSGAYRHRHEHVKGWHRMEHTSAGHRAIQQRRAIRRQAVDQGRHGQVVAAPRQSLCGLDEVRRLRQRQAGA